MVKKVSKSALFSVAIEIDEDRLKQLKKSPEIVQAAMEMAANYWHTKVLPDHFKKDAHQRYDYALRSKAYRKKQGGKPDLIHSGGLARDLKGRATFTTGSKGVNVKMTARVLNFVPSSANSLDRYVKNAASTKGGGYPNIKREVKALLEAEREILVEMVTREIERLMVAGGFAGVFPRQQ